MVLPPALQRVVLDFITAELSTARAPLEVDLAEQQQVAIDLAIENERLAATIAELTAAFDASASNMSAVEGRAGQLAADLIDAKEDIAREREAAEQARIELAKLELRLEVIPRQARFPALPTSALGLLGRQ